MDDAVVDLWQRAADTYETVVPYFSLMGERIVAQAALAAGEEVLDVACGKGATLVPAARAVLPGGRVLGVDIVPAMVEAAERAAAGAGVDNVEVRVMDGEALELDDESFDAVLCGFGLGFLRAERALPEMARVLRASGRLVTSAPAGGGPNWAFFGELCERYGVASQAHPGGMKLPSPERTLEVFAEAGFSLEAPVMESVRTVFPDEEQWWQWAWSHGQRAYLEQLAPADVEPFKADAFAALRSFAEPGGIPLDQQFMVLRATVAEARRLPRSLKGVEIERVGVVGCGLMGSGIAEVCARAGLDVIVREVDEEAVDRGRRRIATSLDRAVQRRKLDEDERDALLGRLRFTTDFTDLADRQMVVEAVVEAEDLKLDVFAALDKVVEDEQAILASNTSSIPIMKLGMATSRPASVVGIHFFNPVPVLKLVELVTSLLTSDETTTRAESFARDVLGKDVIRSQDRAGFVVNALLIPYLLSAIRMFESGFASREDIDVGMVEGCAHPMGPLALTDLIGLDTTMAVAVSLYEEFKEPLYAPPPLLSRMVEAGLLGRKTGRGFYDYAAL